MSAEPPASANASATAAQPEPRRIVKLSEETINRIAAGEVVQRPSSALKELLENALDAGATSIKVQAKEGGLKLLSIQDNGSGIKKADLPLLCERFATSKLRTYDDLSSIATYGFRGEALASISHVAHLTVTTKTREDACGFKARYSDGRLVPLADSSTDAEPKAVAANDGTLLLVEDLFYNTPTRRKGLRSPGDEYHKILDVCSKYAIHNAGVAISCKKSQPTSNDLSTTTAMSTLDVIGQVYSETVKRELALLEFENKEFAFRCKGYVSGANYSAKRGTFTFFINHRLVDCSALKRNLESFYSNLLPKGGSPFVYLSLQIHPANVDVNVSPTKSEVHFLHQEDMIEIICDELQKTLAGANQSRTFTVQSLLPGALTVPTSTPRALAASQANASGSGTSKRASAPTATFKTPAQRLVRTDAAAQTLDAMFGQQSQSQVQAGASRTAQKRKASDIIELDGEDTEVSGGQDAPMVIDDDEEVDEQDDRSKYRSNDDDLDSTVASTAVSAPGLPSGGRAKIPLSACDLTSIQELRRQVESEKHAELGSVISKHTFVGVVDMQLGQSMLQHLTKLFLVNHDRLAEELFYQLGLRQFGNLGRLHLKPSPGLKDLLEIAVDAEEDTHESGMTKSEIVDLVYETLVARAEMLHEYFSLHIDAEDGTVRSIPMVLPGWTPDLDKLPLFLLRLGVEVDWHSEKGCFSTFLRELAFFNTPEPLPEDDTPADIVDSEQDEAGKKQLEDKVSQQKWQLRHVVFPAMMRYLVPPKSLVDCKAVVHVASLENLYKVFERC